MVAYDRLSFSEIKIKEKKKPEQMVALTLNNLLFIIVTIFVLNAKVK